MMSNGITPESAFRTVISVALYRPVIALKRLFCSIVSFATGVILLSRISFGKYYTDVIAGRTTVMYTCRALFGVAPHVDAATLVKASVCLVTLARTSLI